MSDQTTYSRPAKTFHWVMALLIICVWLIGFYAAHLRPDPKVGTSVTVHKAIAATIIFIAAARLIYRLTHRYPALPKTMSAPMTWAANSAHVLLYALAMIAAPLSGWYWSSVSGYPIPFLGLFNLPPLVAKDRSLYDVGMWAHRSIVWTVGGLVALHILAALKHHFFDKDDILGRMLPSRRNAQPKAKPSDEKLLQGH